MALKLKYMQKEAFTSKTNHIPFEANKTYFKWIDLSMLGREVVVSKISGIHHK